MARTGRAAVVVAGPVCGLVVWLASGLAVHAEGDASLGAAPLGGAPFVGAAPQPSLAPAAAVPFWVEEWRRRTVPGTEPFVAMTQSEPGMFADGGAGDVGYVLGDPEPKGWGEVDPHLWVRLRAVGLGAPWAFLAMTPDGRGWIERDNVQTIFGPRAPKPGSMPAGSEWVVMWADEAGRVRALLRSLDGVLLAHVGIDTMTGAVVGDPLGIRQTSPVLVAADGQVSSGSQAVFGRHRFTDIVVDRAWRIGAVGVEDGVVLWEGLLEPDPWEGGLLRRAFWVMDVNEGWVSEVYTDADVDIPPPSFDGFVSGDGQVGP